MKKLLAAIVFSLISVVSVWATDITITQNTIANSHGYTGTNIKLRIYYTGCSGSNFIDSTGAVIMCGNVGASTGFYKELTVTVNTLNGTLTIPQHTVASTDDSSSPTVLATGVFFVSNTKRDTLYSNWVITRTLGTTVTFAQLWSYNQAASPSNPSPTYLSAADTAALIAASSQAPLSEIPNGAVNGSNQTYTISEPIVLDSEVFTLNGVHQKRTTNACVMGTETYSISGQTITSCLPPQTGDSVLVSYRIAAPNIGTVDPATRIRETGGPTVLLVQAIADGECIRRSGSTIAGITCGGGGGGGGLADPGGNGIIKRTALNTTLPAIANVDFLTPTGIGTGLTALNASQLLSGTVPDARFPAILPAVSGVNLTNLNASNITAGTLPDARLSANVPLLNAVNAFTTINSFGSVGIGTTTPDRPLEVLSAVQPQLRLTHIDATQFTDFTVSSGGTLLISPTGNLTFDAAGNQIDPSVNYDQNLGQLSKKYLTLHAAELWVETLVAQSTIATIGGRILVGPTTPLIADLAPATATIDVRYNNLNNGDRVYMEASGAVEYMAITSAATAISGGFRFSVTRNLDGTGANQWYAGDAVFNTGVAGNGFIDIYSVRGVRAGTEVGPTIVGNVRNTSTFNDWSTHWAIGNLNGLYGYGSNTPGVGLGQYAAGKAHLTMDATNGLRIFTGLSTVNGQWAINGDITVGQVAASQGNVLISSGALAIRNNTTARINMTAAGVLTINDSAGTPKITLDAAAGMTLDGKLQMLGANSAIAIGTTPPTSASAGDGIWMDRTGIYGLDTNVLQAKFDAVTGAIIAGAGNVVLDSSGLSIADGIGTINSVKWTLGGSTVSRIYGDSDGTNSSLTTRAHALTSGGIGAIVVTAGNSSAATEVNFVLEGDGTSAVSYASLSGNNFRGLAIGTIGAPVVSAVLDLNSTTGALVVTRLTTGLRDALTATNGMVIYNTTTNKLQVRAAGAWVDLH